MREKSFSCIHALHEDGPHHAAPAHESNPIKLHWNIRSFVKVYGD